MTASVTPSNIQLLEKAACDFRPPLNIRSGPAGGFLGKLTIQEIARLANVSVGTVDRALRSRKGISPNTRERVLEVARRLNYQPNPVARALSLGRAHFRIGVCLPRIPEFFDHLHEGVLDEVHRHEHLGLQVVYHPYRQLGVDEVEGVRAILSQDIQALVVCPTDPRVNALIDEAEVSNIRVLCMFSEARGSSRSTVVWVDPGLTGRLAAELMGKFVSPGSEVAVITGLLDMDVHRRRTQSFLDTFPTFCAGGRVVEVIEGHKDQDQGFQKCVNLLERTKTLAGIWVGHGYATPICWALRARGLAGNVTLVATHLHRDMIPYIENGSIHASIYQDPYAHGQTAVRLLVGSVVSSKPLPSTYALSPQVVLRSNLYLFREANHLERAPE